MGDWRQTDMRNFTYPDGSSLYIESSGAVTGPDQVGGQHFGTCYHYARIGLTGQWKRTTTRSMHSTWTLAGAAESAAEAFEAITETDG